MKKFIIICSLLFIYLNINAQYTLKGVIKDIQNNQPIPSAKINVLNSNENTTTDDYGVFNLKTSSETLTLSISAIGYEKKQITVTITGTSLVVVEPTNLSTSEIQVEANKTKNIETPQSIGFFSKEDLNRDIGLISRIR